MKKFTNQEFVTKLNMLNTNVSPLEEYKTSNQKIKFQPTDLDFQRKYNLLNNLKIQNILFFHFHLF